MKRSFQLAVVLVGFASLAAPEVRATCTGTFFPVQGDTLTVQSQKTPAQVGLNPGIVTALEDTIKSYPAGDGYAACTLPTAARWALWRHGRLVLYRGDLATNTEIKSARKTIHAATIGALIQMGSITDDRTLSHNVMDIWNAQPSTVPAGNCDLNATLKQVLVQTSGYSDPTKCPGEEWHYHDSNPPVVNNVAARAYRGTNATRYTSNYTEVLGAVLFNKIKATGVDHLDPTGRHSHYGRSSGPGTLRCAHGERWEMGLDTGRPGLVCRRDVTAPGERNHT